MPRIDQDYTNDGTVTGADKVIGTDAADGSTKNYTIDSIKGYMEGNLTGASDTYISLDGKTVITANGLTTSIANATINTDGTVTSGDVLRGVDSADGSVKNYTVQSIKDFTLSGGDTSTIYTTDVWVLSIIDGVIVGVTPGSILTDGTVTGTDLLRGTNSADGTTMNYTVQSISDFTLSSGVASDLILTGGTELKSFTITNGLVTNVSTYSLTTAPSVAANDLFRGELGATPGNPRNFTAQGIKDFTLSGGATGSFTAGSGETVTVVDGVITSII